MIARLNRILAAILLAVMLCTGCASPIDKAQVAATTLPVYEFTARLCQGTDIRIAQLITENVSCLHDYSLQVSQMRAAESAEVIVCSGAGLEDSLADMFPQTAAVIDASQDVSLLCAENTHDHDHSHTHEQDPHIWLSPANARIMAKTICQGLCAAFPAYSNIFEANLQELDWELIALEAYGKQQLAELSCRKLVTFHDGFAYFADAFDLQILRALEEESGSEASAAEIIELANTVYDHSLPAIFTEKNGSTAAASILNAETGVSVYTLDMAISGKSYFEAMYHNIDTIKEALG